MSNISLNLDVLNKEENSELGFALQQGNNNVTFVFSITSDGVPLTFNSELDLSIKAYVTTFNRLDFKSSVVECLESPTYEFISDGEDPATYTLEISADTSVIQEILMNPYKNNLSFKISTVVSEEETFYSFTTLFEYNVLTNQGYILDSYVSSEEEE